MSSSIACPNCGAPASVTPGQTTAMCTFCSRSFQVGAPQPPPPPPSPYAGSPYGAPPPAPPRQMIVVVPPGGSYDPTATAVAAAGWAGFRIVMALIPVFIIAMVGGITWFTSRSGGAAAGFGGGGGGWTGISPLVCGGNDEINATGVNSSTGITAGGNCHVTCTGCTITAPVGVSAGGNAQVDLIGCHITGTSGEGIVASGNAQVRLSGGSTLSGKVINTGNASVSGAPTQPAVVPTVPPAKPTSNPSPVAPTPSPSKRR